MVINMFSHNFKIYFLVAVLCVFMCAGNSFMKGCIETDKRSLLNLKYNFTDDFGLLSSWKREVDCCEWNGISCNDLTGHVTKLQVPSNYSRYLAGKIGYSLCDLQHLTHLNISFSHFGGNKIPKCIGSLNQLRELVLSQANLGGDIPHELWNLSNLQTLDLRYNDDLIVNDLEWISNISSLRHLDLSGVNLSQAIDWQVSLSRKAPPTLRELILSEAYLGGIVSLQLGNLSGEIPSSLTSLVALASLNLSRNNLTGFIPKNMGQIRMLESLDLSKNSLTGRIPISFSALSFLSFLNLSFNNLSGEIPWTTQLQTFDPSSYVGNNELCGQPLIKGCSRNDDFDQNHKNSSSMDANQEDELITLEFFISMTLGFLVGFWGVCGTLILKSSWRAAYFQLFTNMHDWIYVRLAIFKERM